jgi:hypothetical protein
MKFTTNSQTPVFWGVFQLETTFWAAHLRNSKIHDVKEHWLLHKPIVFQRN